MKNQENKGITLIALIITIVVMLILVVVSVQIALDTGLFESAGKATKKWEGAQANEGEISSGKVTIGGVTYNSVEEYTNLVSGGKTEVDFEKLFQTAEKHPEQSATNNDIGIAEDGSIVNLDLWPYMILSDGTGYILNNDMTYNEEGYSNENIVDGKIQGKIPMYIKEEGDENFYPVISLSGTFYGCTSLTEVPVIPNSVTDMSSTFYGCTALTETPEIPSTVTNMASTFGGCTALTEAPVIPSSVTGMGSTFSNCTALTEAPVIPSSVTDMGYTFLNCTSLTEAPEIPNSVTDMSYTFYGCTALTEAPEIPNSVTDMSHTFKGCTSLTGTLTINANPTRYSNCLYNAATAEGCNLVLNGSSTMLNVILATKSASSNITIGS